MRLMTNGETKLPEIGELVVGRVTRVDKFGAYIILEDYPGVEAFVHISEISLKWVRNIRDYLREGQRTVFKIIRVNPATQQVDVSLRRVSQKEKTEKILEWKRKQKINRILSILKERAKVSEEEIDKFIRQPFDYDFERIYSAFEKVSEGEPITEIIPNLPEKMKEELENLIKQEIKHKIAIIKGDLKLTTTHRNGAEAIRKAAKEAESLAGSREEVSITVKGPPYYLLRIKAADEERAEELLREILEKTSTIMREYGGVSEFKRS